MNEKIFHSAEDGVRALTAYGIQKKLINREDAMWAANTLFHLLSWEPDPEFTIDGVEKEDAGELEPILKYLLDDAVSRGVIEDGTACRDLFDTELMGVLTPKPSDVIRKFWDLYKEDEKSATDYFYQLSLDSDYIRTYRVKKDLKWITKTAYGDLDITINLSKPEKDPKAIAAALKNKKQKYPKCALCRENQGYAGRLDHPARETIRYIPLTLGGEQWYLQYSPYVYYNEHCIVFSGKHTPMKIDRMAFHRLLEFISIFPHYTVGSNADLPIVGGSILTHEHFQGGRYEFAMARAGIREELHFRGFEDVKAGIVNWPMSVIRLDGENPARIEELSDRILTAWRTYSDPESGILAETDGTPHNTITPIARRRGKLYELDLVLRNNRTTEEYPLGIFHPHQELHHIKKENIGLIEVMGLAVLPARLKTEMARLTEVVMHGGEVHDDETIASHADWTEEILSRHPEYRPENLKADAAENPETVRKFQEILKEEIGVVFAKVLECCGVFKDTEEGRAAFRKFAEICS
ncbi:MAG: UDP-glucose--hexose-1-phosphate uridylyltransferase [Eubacteriales bacterium]|jgi:UDPglucose--hexose-1-phosphate uridylyltransferase